MYIFLCQFVAGDGDCRGHWQCFRVRVALNLPSLRLISRFAVHPSSESYVADSDGGSPGPSRVTSQPGDHPMSRRDHERA